MASDVDKTSWESISGTLAFADLELAAAADSKDPDDLINCLDTILKLISRLNDREAPQ